jgi:hypothetical protein
VVESKFSCHTKVWEKETDGKNNPKNKTRIRIGFGMMEFLLRENYKTFST